MKMKKKIKYASLLSLDKIKNEIQLAIIGTSIGEKKDLKIFHSNLFCQGRDKLQRCLFEFVFFFFLTLLQ